VAKLGNACGWDLRAHLEDYSMSFNLTITVISVCLTLLAVIAMLKGLRPAIMFRGLRFFSDYGADDRVEHPEEMDREDGEEEQRLTATTTCEVNGTPAIVPVETTTITEKVVA